LAERPDYFCEIIRSLYLSKNEPAPQPEQKPEVDEAKANAAQQAYRLFSDWDHPPGLFRDGKFDGQKLNEWCAAVKAQCVESGHWEVASHQIGEVLYYAPTNAEGLWEESVCELLDSKDDVEYRRGLQIRVFNSRGVHGFSGGKDETALAEKWERLAGLAEAKGFVRLGTTLRELGKSYREDARRAITENRHDFERPIF
jgi:hypothetical protein